MIYLSICIPTYNRSSYLRDAINSIISEKEFVETDEIEIVVADNCSTDDTGEVMQQFVSQFPSKIKYHRNEENILDRNFEMALSLGSGIMLKLNNDTLNLRPNSLGELLGIVKYCHENNFLPYLVETIQEPLTCSNVSDFVSKVSYYCTWIGSLFIGKSVFETFKDFSKESRSQLIQVDVVMQMLEANCKLLLIPNSFFISVYPTNKGGYDLPKVFMTNYFKILGNYLKTPAQLKILKREKLKTLYGFILPWLLSIRLNAITKTFNYTFDVSNYKKVIREEFSTFTYIKFEAKLLLYFKLKKLIPASLVNRSKQLLGIR